MVQRAGPLRSQQVAVLASVLALHAALIALFLRQSAEVAPVAKPSLMAMIALNAEQPAAVKPPPPALPAKVANTFKPVVEFSIPVESESDSPAGASGVCSTLGAVLDALLLDPVAIDAIRRAPPESRSIAEAVVIWNEGWSPFALDPVAPLWLVRASIERTLQSIDAGCLDETLVGPRLLPIPDGTGMGTIFIVVGSGTWTWRELIEAPVSPASIVAPPPAVPQAR